MAGIHLSPAETLLLLAPLKTYPIDMMSYTLAELVFMNVVKIRGEKVQASEHSTAVIKQLTLRLGPNANLFEPAPHHIPFLNPIRAVNGIGIHRLAQGLWKTYGKEGGPFKKKLIMKSIGEGKELFSTKSYSPFLSLQRTRLGKSVKADMKRQFAQGERHKNWEKLSASELKSLLFALGPNLLLLKGVDFGELAHLEKINPRHTDLLAGDTPATIWYEWKGMERNLNFSVMKQLQPFINRFEGVFRREMATENRVKRSRMSPRRF